MAAPAPKRHHPSTEAVELLSVENAHTYNLQELSGIIARIDTLKAHATEAVDDALNALNQEEVSLYDRLEDARNALNVLKEQLERIDGQLERLQEAQDLPMAQQEMAEAAAIMAMARD